MSNIDWTQFSDVQLFLILTALEEAETDKSPRVLEETRTEYTLMRWDAEKEYRQRKLHWAMFEGDEE